MRLDLLVHFAQWGMQFLPMTGNGLIGVGRNPYQYFAKVGVADT
jgi:hypothetical protein